MQLRFRFNSFLIRGLLTLALLAAVATTLLLVLPIGKAQPNVSSDNMSASARAIVYCRQVLARYQKRDWNDRTTIRLRRELAANPPVKYPLIQIFCGNSHVGSFDHKAARKATINLFALYGIRLQRDVPVRGPGYAFVADGYDPVRRVGFELVAPPKGLIPVRVRDEGPNKPRHRRDLPPRPTHVWVRDPRPDEPANARLDEREQAALDKAVSGGQVFLFVAHAERFPNMDGDLYTPMEYYLASVVDYLEDLTASQRRRDSNSGGAVRAERPISLDTVLGKRPPAMIPEPVPPRPAPAPPAPNGGTPKDALPAAR